MPSNHLILCCTHLLLPSILPSIRGFSSESVLCIRWPKYWSFSFRISPSNEYSGMPSFRIVWFDLLAVQGTLEESSPTPQFKSISYLALSFFTVQLLHPYMTTGNDPTDVGNLISSSSAFSKSSLNMWKFKVHITLKPGLEKFEHYFSSVWDEWNCVVVWTFIGIACLWDKNETDIFQSCRHCWVFQICWCVSAALTASSFRIWNSSTGIPSPSLVLSVMMLPVKPTWLYIPGSLLLGEWWHHRGYLCHEDLFCIALLCILATSS